MIVNMGLIRFEGGQPVSRSTRRTSTRKVIYTDPKTGMQLIEQTGPEFLTSSPLPKTDPSRARRKRSAPPKPRATVTPAEAPLIQEQREDVQVVQVQRPKQQVQTGLSLAPTAVTLVSPGFESLSRRRGLEEQPTKGIVKVEGAITPVSSGFERLLEERRKEQAEPKILTPTEQARSFFQTGETQLFGGAVTMKLIEPEAPKLELRATVKPESQFERDIQFQKQFFETREIAAMREGKKLKAIGFAALSASISPFTTKEKVGQLAVITGVSAGLGVGIGAIGAGASKLALLTGGVIGAFRIKKTQQKIRTATFLSPVARREAIAQEFAEVGAATVGFRAGFKIGQEIFVAKRTRLFTKTLEQEFKAMQQKGVKFDPKQKGLTVIERRTGAVLRERQTQIMKKEFDVTQEFLEPQLGEKRIGGLGRQLRLRQTLVNIPSRKITFELITESGKTVRPISSSKQTRFFDIEEEEEIGGLLSEFVFKTKFAFESGLKRITLPTSSPITTPPSQAIIQGLQPQQAPRLFPPISIGRAETVGRVRVKFVSEDISRIQLPSLVSVQRTKTGLGAIQEEDFLPFLGDGRTTLVPPTRIFPPFPPPSRPPVSPPTFAPPPGLDFPKVIFGRIRRPKGKRKRVTRRTRFQPSLLAIQRRQFGRRPRVLTGLEVRPIPLRVR
jgi:hypothetical protein